MFPLPAVVTVSKSEWDSFLDEFTNLVQKYELVLAQLNLARTRIEGLTRRRGNRLQLAVKHYVKLMRRWTDYAMKRRMS